MQMQARQLWQAVLGDMQTRLPRNAFDNWLRPTTLVAFEHDIATVSAPNLFTADTLQNRYAGQIERPFSEIVGRSVRVDFVVQSDAEPDESPLILPIFHPRSRNCRIATPTVRLGDREEGRKTATPSAMSNSCRWRRPRRCHRPRTI